MIHNAPARETHGAIGHREGADAQAALHLPRLPVLDWPRLHATASMRTPSVMDMPHCAFLRSGRIAIAVALRAAGVRHGDRVLVPTYHCPTMIAPVVAAGAVPVFFGVDGAGAPQLDPLTAAELRNVRAMLAAHYFGIPAPMAPVRTFCDARRIALIEDCAHAMFGVAGTRPIGQWGDYAIASLTKFFPVTDGGCIAACNPLALPPIVVRPPYEQLKAIANGLELAVTHRRLAGLGAPLRTLFRLQNGLRRSPRAMRARGAPAGDVSRWIEEVARIEASAPATTAFSRWLARHADRERIVTLRRRNFARLCELLGDVPGARPLYRTLPDNAVPYVFPLLVDEPQAHYLRVRSAGIPIFRWDEIWPQTPRLDADHGVHWSTHLFQIGCHQDLSLSDLDVMAGALKRILAA